MIVLSRIEIIEIEIKTRKQDLEEQHKQFASLIKDKIDRIRKEEMWEDYDDEDFFEYIKTFLSLNL